MNDDDLRKYLPSAETLAYTIDEAAAQAATENPPDNSAIKASLAELLAMRKPGEQPFDWLDDPEWLPDAEPSERVEHVPPTELPRGRVPHVTLTKIRVAPEVIGTSPKGARAAAAGEGKGAMLDPRRIPTQPRLGTPGAPLAPAEQVILPSTWTTTTKDPGVGAASSAAPLLIKEEGSPSRTEGQAALTIEKAALPSTHAPAPPPGSARPAMSRGRMGVIGLAISLALTGLVVLAKQADTVSLPEPAAVVTAAPLQADPQVPPMKSTTAATVSPRPPQPGTDGGAADSPAALTAPPPTSHLEPSAPPAMSTVPTTPPKSPRPSSAGATTGHSLPTPSPTASSSTPPSAPAPTVTSPWGEREF